MLNFVIACCNGCFSKRFLFTHLVAEVSSNVLQLMTDGATDKEIENILGNIACGGTS